ncbi:MAG: radical SAM/SPASM domain-containing protein [Elusimicrobiota bacterium]
MLLNNAEFERREITLKSTPRLVTLGTHNSCNAKCIFCLEGRYDRFSLELYKNFFEAKMGRYIKNAEKVTFTGFGEILWVPGIEEFLDHINETLPDAWKIFTTNATPLRPSVVDRLLEGKYVIRASVHASNAALHRKQTQLENQFDEIVGNLARLADRRDRLSGAKRLHIELVDVLNTGNIHDLPEFLKLAWRLRAQSVTCTYMTMFAPEHVDLSCFFDQERANRSVLEARELVGVLQQGAFNLPNPAAFEVSLPPLFDRGEKPEAGAGEICSDPWQQVYVELQGSVLPCCFWGEHVGDLKKGQELDDIWNGEFQRDLRRGMASGDPHPWCRSCVRYRGFNVNDIYCHLTNRPPQQAIVLREIVRRGLDAGPYQRS